ncbi:MAG: uncharacterized protein QOJ60_1393 [Actinomycetota bacterium]|nr:uncharacterized protein [Actinomycetota bacterium]
MLGHGAGGGIGSADLVAIARALPQRGVAVVRVESPWRLAGRRVATPPATLDAAWVAVLAELALPGPVVVGGRSAGARVACRTAGQVGAAGVVALAFPLHPPGRPERSRLGELLGAGVPTLVVQGERDAFGGPDRFPPGTELASIPFADHSFRVPAAVRAAGADPIAAVVGAVAGWLDRLLP